MSTDAIRDFLAGDRFAVVGASSDRRKFGNRVLRCYLQHGKEALPVNPKGEPIEGVESYARLADLPAGVHGVSVITPPDVSERIVDEAHERGLTRVWFQPGAESREAIERARAHGMTVIAGGPCVLVELPKQ
ncbi:MAG: CoA-binding protein [Polyangiaceae bacterium]